MMNASTDVAGAEHHRPARWLSVAGLVGLLLVGVFSALERQPVAPRSADAPVRSAERGHDLRKIPGFTSPEDRVPVQPAVAVTRTRTL